MGGSFENAYRFWSGLKSFRRRSSRSLKKERAKEALELLGGTHKLVKLESERHRARMLQGMELSGFSLTVRPLVLAHLPGHKMRMKRSGGFFPGPKIRVRSDCASSTCRKQRVIRVESGETQGHVHGNLAISQEEAHEIGFVQSVSVNREELIIGVSIDAVIKP